MAETISSTSKNQTWKIIDLIKWGEEFLASKGIENSRKETEWFLAHILDCDRINLYVRFDEIVDKDNLQKFKSCILRRLKHEPFQYIINKAPFYGRDFFVNEDVLIPRTETETFIDILKTRKPVETLLDVGTGSGCIAITISLENLAKNIFAIDNSDTALKIAKKNAKYHCIKNITFSNANYLQDKITKKYDVIVSNPPYISQSEISGLQPEIKQFEPIKSLTDNKDGLTFFKHFSNKADNILNESGVLLIEFGGEPQLSAIKEIFSSNKFDIAVHNDINKSPRVLEVSIIIT